MNAHNNENDPFEDVFRDRFADFESEPNAQLWQKIEPQLPVNSTRKFSYWQISAVLVLLLTGFWTYREIYSTDDLTEKIMKSYDRQTVNIAKSEDNHLHINTKSNDSRTAITLSPNYGLTEENPKQNTDNKDLIINEAEKNTTKDIMVKSVENRNTAKFPNKSLQKKKEAFLNNNESTKEKSFLFSTNNTTTDIPKTSFNKTFKNSFLKNKNTSLNLSSFNNSKEKKQELISDNSSNYQSTLSVFSNREQISRLNKNHLIFLDLKSYHLLGGHFKNPKIKFAPAPKKDDYFKERKPLEMYVSVMPLLNYYTITPNGNDANYVHNISVNNEDDRLGFYTQAGVIFTLSDRFKLRTGLTFTKTNHSISYQIRTDSLIIQSPDKQGVDVSFSELNKTYSQSANYLGTKVEVQYIFWEGEGLTHYLNVGLEGAYRLNGGNQFNGFANFAYGITRRIGDNTYLFIEPTFSYSLNQQNENNSFLLVKPNKIGFNIGVNFKIK